MFSLRFSGIKFLINFYGSNFVLVKFFRVRNIFRTQGFMERHYCFMWIIHYGIVEFLHVLQLCYVVLEVRCVVL